MRSICVVIGAVLDQTEVDSIVTRRSCEQLNDEICKALRAEGYETHAEAAGRLGGRTRGMSPLLFVPAPTPPKDQPRNGGIGNIGGGRS